MRSRKVEKAVKEDNDFVAVAEDYTLKDPAEYTNINSTAFCPYIKHTARGHMHRQYSTGMPEPNYRYHWWQLKNFTSVQFCKLQRDPEKDFEKCEKFFTKCEFYLAEEAGKKQKK